MDGAVARNLGGGEDIQERSRASERGESDLIVICVLSWRNIGGGRGWEEGVDPARRLDRNKTR